ncbi:hypothetical protein C8Q73DRAFT_674764 [Cubamyces lactineus]|nr:hypothetical protein C8Q73DRAFT_674764 [Cubamyces lactineus]
MPLTLKGYSASIRCEDKDLEVYDVRVEGEDKVSCWIASEAGKTFTVHYGGESAETLMCVHTHMDSRLVHLRAHTRCRTGSAKYVHISATEVRPFLFASLVLTDDEATASTEVNGELGTISIKMFRVKAFVENQAPYTGTSVANIGPVHERSKKAGVHAVAFGDIIMKEPQTTSRAIEQECKPFATFVFHYRPIEHLQALGIVPLASLPPASTQVKRHRTDLPENDSHAGSSKRKKQRKTSSVKSEDKNDVGDEDADDLVSLEQQLAVMQKRVEEARQVRKARAIIKRELSPIRFPPSLSGEVIDLTSD